MTVLSGLSLLNAMENNERLVNTFFVIHIVSDKENKMEILMPSEYVLVVVVVVVVVFGEGGSENEPVCVSV